MGRKPGESWWNEPGREFELIDIDEGGGGLVASFRRHLNGVFRWHSINDKSVRYLYAALGCVICLAVSGCDGGTALRGYVRDSAGAPIAGASISMNPEGSPRNLEVQSAQDGSYSITMLHAPGARVTVTVAKQGYVPVQRKFHSRGDVLHGDFTLEPVKPTT